MKEAAKTTALIVRSLIIILLLYFGIEQITDLFYDADLDLLAVISNASLAVLMYLGVRWFNKRFNGLSISDSGFGKRGLIGNFIIGVTLAGVILSLTLYLAYLIGGIRIDFIPLTDNFSLFEFIMLNLVVACWEEMYFRGLVINTLLKKNVSFTFTVIISSALFALLHIFSFEDLSILSPFWMFGIFLGSAFMALLYILTRSIWTTIGFHFFWDFLFTAFETSENDFGLVQIPTYEQDLLLIDNISIVVCGVVLALMLVLMRKRIREAVISYYKAIKIASS